MNTLHFALKFDGGRKRQFFLCVGKNPFDHVVVRDEALLSCRSGSRSSSSGREAGRSGGGSSSCWRVVVVVLFSRQKKKLFA